MPHCQYHWTWCKRRRRGAEGKGAEGRTGGEKGGQKVRTRKEDRKKGRNDRRREMEDGKERK